AKPAVLKNLQRFGTVDVSLATGHVLGGSPIPECPVTVRKLHVTDILHANTQEHLFGFASRAVHQIEVARVINALQTPMIRRMQDPQVMRFGVEDEDRLDFKRRDHPEVARHLTYFTKRFTKPVDRFINGLTT